MEARKINKYEEVSRKCYEVERSAVFNRPVTYRLYSFISSYPGEIVMCQEEMAFKLGLSVRSIQRGMLELVRKGFVKRRYGKFKRVFYSLVSVALQKAILKDLALGVRIAIQDTMSYLAKRAARKAKQRDALQYPTAQSQPTKETTYKTITKKINNLFCSNNELDARKNEQIARLRAYEASLAST